MVQVRKSGHAAQTSTESKAILRAAGAPGSAQTRAHGKRSARVARPSEPDTLGALHLAPVFGVIDRHVKLTPLEASKLREDLGKEFVRQHAEFTRSMSSNEAVGDRMDAGDILTTQAAADLVNVSRPFLVRHIDSGDIPLLMVVGNQRRVRKQDVLAWHERVQARSKKARSKLLVALDDELFG